MTTFTENLKLYGKLKTCSIAFPSSIFDNTPAPQLEAYLVGQIARAATIFHIQEIIIYDEETNTDKCKIEKIVKLFEYAECPQYLRKDIFAIEPDLKYAGMINPLEAQHHLRTSQLECPYREGITINSSLDSSEVNIGLSKPVEVKGTHDPATRVTVKVDPNDLVKMQSMLGKHSIKRVHAQVVSPSEPLAKLRLFWGYYVRSADCLSQVFSKNTFLPEKKNFYDLIIGTSERGTIIDEVNFEKDEKNEEEEGNSQRSKKSKKNVNQHILVVFGGVRGLEYSMSKDPSLKGVTDVSKLFHHYINTCPNQGSNTIRTEEAILITLSALRPKLNLT